MRALDGKVAPISGAAMGMGVARAAFVPLGRFADPHELSEMALFMASDASSCMTASEVLVVGGMPG